MNKEITDKLLRNLTTYTIENNIAGFNDTTKETSVVRLEDCENHLKQVASTDYDVMKSRYSTLLEFLMSEESLTSSKKWSYESMTVSEYKQDLRHLSGGFLALKKTLTDETRLLVMYIKNAFMSSEESLTEDMLSHYKVKVK